MSLGIIDLSTTRWAETLHKLSLEIKESSSLPDEVDWHEWTLIQAYAADIFYEAQRRLREAKPKIEAKREERSP
jgi:hypothetical protein